MEKNRLTRAHILLFLLSAVAVVFSSAVYVRGVLRERQEEAEYASLAAARAPGGGGRSGGAQKDAQSVTQARPGGGQPDNEQRALNSKPKAARQNAIQSHAMQSLGELAQELKLTPDQRTKIQKIQETMALRLQAIRNNASLSQEQQREKLASVREDTDKKIKQALTPEQKTKYNALQSQHAS